MNGPLHYLVSERPTSLIQLDAGMEEIIAEETLPQELCIKKWSFGLTSALLLGGSVIAGAMITPDIVKSVTPSLHPQNLDLLASKSIEAASIVSKLCLDGLTAWMGLEFGALALESDRRLQSLSAES